MNTPKKILYLVTEDWYFCSHRLALAQAAQEAGYSVTVVTRVNHHGERITAAGLHLIPLNWRRGERNPLLALRDLWQVYRIIRRVRPDLLHNVALKPVLYGSLAGSWVGVPRVVNAIAGLGVLFTSRKSHLRVLSTMLQPLLRWALSRGGTRVIVQNPDDLQTLVDRDLVPAPQTVLIRGAGVDTGLLFPTPEPTASPPLVLLAARMLWSKGVGVFVAAAGILKEQGYEARFVLAGDTDPDNPDAIRPAQLTAWHDSGLIEWWGYRDDLPEVLSQSHIVCLPSCYGEGIPKVLLEAAALGRPIITTDWPGCREVVRHGWNGLTVPPQDAQALAQAIHTLLLDPNLRQTMGNHGRRLAVEAFSLEQVVAETLAVYHTLLTHPDSNP